ncbi:hypothetical protein BgiMline_005868, partial [Biomphalaria glabrata]
KNSTSRRSSTLLPLTDMSTGNSLLSTLMCFLCFVDLTKGQCSLQKMSDTYMREADLIDQNYGSDI